jgi:predicted amidophosphoribosyltransferase
MIARKRQIEGMLDSGLTLTAIGEQLGVSRTTIANWLRGSQDASPTCPDCANPMNEPAVRCGLCQEELDREMVPA